MKRTHPILRAFWADRRAAAAAVFLGVEILVVLLLPLFLGQDPNLTDREAGFWAPPSSQHLLGTQEALRKKCALGWMMKCFCLATGAATCGQQSAAGCSFCRWCCFSLTCSL